MDEFIEKLIECFAKLLAFSVEHDVAVFVFFGLIFVLWLCCLPAVFAIRCFE